MCVEEVTLERSRLDRWLRRRNAPALCRLTARMVIEDRPPLGHSVVTGFPAGFPLPFGPFPADGPLLAVQRAPLFEIVTLFPDSDQAELRAGYASVAPDAGRDLVRPIRRRPALIGPGGLSLRVDQASAARLANSAGLALAAILLTRQP